MKKTLFTLVAMALTFATTFGKGGYETAMHYAIDSLYSAQTVSDFNSVANMFERIGNAEKDRWLPYYYSAYAYAMMSTQERDKSLVDGYLDKAEANMDKSEKLKGDKVELLALRAFANMMRIGVDPATRGQEYSMKSVGYLQQAMQIDNINPRVVLMMGQMQYGTAQFFGSGTGEACSTFLNAKELFEKEANSDRGLLPAWGKPQAEGMLKMCSETTEDN